LAAALIVTRPAPTSALASTKSPRVGNSFGVRRLDAALVPGGLTPITPPQEASCAKSQPAKSTTHRLPPGTHAPLVKLRELCNPMNSLTIIASHVINKTPTDNIRV
jgi:hypothetical protein